MTKAALGFDALLSQIETTRGTETVTLYVAGSGDLEWFDQIAITASVKIGGVDYKLTATLGVDAYPEVVDRIEALTREHLARQVIEALR
jgi:hypothetical protein